jgi:hypothetical protein
MLKKGGDVASLFHFEAEMNRALAGGFALLGFVALVA